MAKGPLLLHQFLAGIPKSITKQLRASGKVTTLDAAITCAKLLITIDSELVASRIEKPDELLLLREQVAILTEQVASCFGHKPVKGCVHCNQVGHLQHDCCNHKCFNCGILGHLSKDCWW